MVADGLARRSAGRHNTVRLRPRAVVERQADRSSEGRARASRIEDPRSWAAADVSACARGAAAMNPGRTDKSGVVEVTNHHALPVEIYAFGSGITHRLGTVHPGHVRPFRDPSEPDRQRLGRVRRPAPGGGGQPFRSGEILLAPGSVVDFVIAAPALQQHRHAATLARGSDGSHAEFQRHPLHFHAVAARAGRLRRPPAGARAAAAPAGRAGDGPPGRRGLPPAPPSSSTRREIPAGAARRGRRRRPRAGATARSRCCPPARAALQLVPSSSIRVTCSTWRGPRPRSRRRTASAPAMVSCRALDPVRDHERGGVVRRTRTRSSPPAARHGRPAGRWPRTAPRWKSPRRPASPMRVKASRSASVAGSNRRSGVRGPTTSSVQDSAAGVVPVAGLLAQAAGKGDAESPRKTVITSSCGPSRSVRRRDGGGILVGPRRSHRVAAVEPARPPAG